MIILMPHFIDMLLIICTSFVVFDVTQEPNVISSWGLWTVNLFGLVCGPVFITINLTPTYLALGCYLTISSERRERGIVKDRLQNNTSRRKDFECKNVTDPPYPAISSIILNHDLERSRRSQHNSLTASTRSSPLVKVFMLFLAFHQLITSAYLTTTSCLG